MPRDNYFLKITGTLGKGTKVIIIIGIGIEIREER